MMQRANSVVHAPFCVIGAFHRISTFHYVSIFTESGTLTRLGAFTCLGTIYHHISTRVIIVRYVLKSEKCAKANNFHLLILF